VPAILGVMREITMPIPTRAVTARTVREQGITRGPVIVTGGGPLCAGEHQRAARELAVALGAQVVEAVPGRRLAPEILAASVVLPSAPAGLLAPLASLCAWLQLPYAGCSPRAATLASDPGLVAPVLTDAGFATAAGVAVDATSARGLDFVDPVRLRPVGGGPSLGWSIASSPKDLRDGLALALAFGVQAWVEELLDGRALQVAALRTRGGEVALGSIHEIAPDSLFAADRPMETAAHHVIADLDPRSDALVRRSISGAYRALGLRGPASFEVVLDGPRLTIGAVDAAPALTRDGLLTAQFAATGWSYADLATELLATAY